VVVVVSGTVVVGTTSAICGDGAVSWTVACAGTTCAACGAVVDGLKGIVVVEVVVVLVAN